MAERRSPKPKVVGSIPTAPATNRSGKIRIENMSNSSRVETVSNSGDKAKVILAVVALVAGIFAYSFFTDYSIYARLGVFLVGLAVAIALLAISDTGKRMLGFATGSYAELKRVVWPTRKETTRTTGIVFAFASVMAVLLWIIDKLITWVVYGVVLGWN